jgi:hypothetical protein
VLFSAAGIAERMDSGMHRGCDRMIEAHGGHERWRGISRIMATLSMGGLEFVSHMQPRPLRNVEVAADARNTRLTLSPFPERGQSGVFEASRVYIQDEDDAVISERPAPGTVTRSLRHWMLWDTLDVLFVTGITAWQALLFPWLLARTGVNPQPAPPGSVDSSRCVRVSFPADLPLVAHEQVFHAGSTGLVERIDYAPEAYAGWLRVCHLMEDFDVFDGLVLPARQSLYPCLPNAKPWRGARMAWLTLDDLRAVPLSPRQAENPLPS